MGERYTPLTDEQKNDRRAEVMARLERGVEAITDSETFRAFLDMQARFHDFSWRNSILIMMQRHDATRVAGLRTWNQLGRFVNKGERGLDILAPSFPKGTTKDEEKDAQPVYFVPVKVFAYEQTSGKPLPEVKVPVLEGDDDGTLYNGLEMLAFKQGITVQETPTLQDGAFGFYLPHKDRPQIAVRTHGDDGLPLPQLQRTKTMAHELAHHYALRRNEARRRTYPEGECIAEACAYVTLSHFGLDSGARSFPYIANWAQNKAVLKEVLGDVQRVSRTMIDGVEGILGVGEGSVGVDGHQHGDDKTPAVAERPAHGFYP